MEHGSLLVCHAEVNQGFKILLECFEYLFVGESLFQRVIDCQLVHYLHRPGSLVFPSFFLVCA